MRATKAFSLIELVVSIVVPLILLPVFLYMDSNADNNFCMSTINALNKSVFIYAEMNRGFMMVWTHKMDANGFMEAPAYPYQTYCCFKAGKDSSIDPKTGLLKDVRGVGLIYTSRILEPAEMFYCPIQRDERSTLAYYPQPWGTAVADPNKDEFIRIGYMYNPWIKREANDYVYEDNLVLAKHPNNRFLLSDLMTGTDNYAHIEGGRVGWNASFLDGHMGTVYGKNINSYMERMEKEGVRCDADWKKWGIGPGPGEQMNPNGPIRYELFKLVAEPISRPQTRPADTGF